MDCQASQYALLAVRQSLLGWYLVKCFCMHSMTFAAAESMYLPLHPAGRNLATRLPF